MNDQPYPNDLCCEWCGWQLHDQESGYCSDACRREAEEAGSEA